MKAFSYCAVLFALVAVLITGPATYAVPAVRDIAAENGIIPCPGPRTLTIIPTDTADNITLGQLSVLNDDVPGRTYIFSETLSLPEGSVTITPAGLVQLIIGLGPNKAVGFTAQANATDASAVISQFFLIQMI